MRGTVAKRLRRIAEKNTTGMPDREFRLSGNKRYKDKDYATHIALVPQCTRYLYKMLKRKYMEVGHA